MPGSASPRGARACDDRRLRSFRGDLRLQLGDSSDDGPDRASRDASLQICRRACNRRRRRRGNYRDPIPPSVIMVNYGLLTETSISALFLAGIIPGLLTVAGFMAAISVMTRLNPTLGPPALRVPMRQTSWRCAACGVRPPCSWSSSGVSMSACSPPLRPPAYSSRRIHSGAHQPQVAAAAAGNNADRHREDNRDDLHGSDRRHSVQQFPCSGVSPDARQDWIGGLPLGNTVILIVIIAMYFVLGCLLNLLAMILPTILIGSRSSKHSAMTPFGSASSWSWWLSSASSRRRSG